MSDDKLLKVSVTGLDQLLKSLDLTDKRIQKALARGTTKSMMLVQASARKRILKGPKTGKKYGKHQSSAKGEAPANDTGHLQRSIKLVAATPGPVVEAAITVESKYGAALEYGTKDGTIKPRPFLIPSLAENAERINAIMIEEINKALDEGTK